MRLLLEKFRLLSWLVLVLASGFVTTGAIDYKAARDALNQVFATSAVPTTSDFVYGEIQQDIQRLLSASSFVARDAFVHNWLLGGEPESDRLSRFLQDVDKRYGTVGSLLVSERSRRQYQKSGAPKPVQSGDPRDAWLSRARKMKTAYEVTVNPEAAGDAALVSVSERIVDDQGSFMAAVEVGLPQSRFARLIENYRSRFGCRVYFVDKTGIIVLGSGAMQHVRDLPGLRRVSSDILGSSAAKPTQSSYREGQSTVYVTTRFIPELSWFVVVQQADRGIQSVQLALILHLVVGVLVIGLVLATVVATINSYRKRLDNAAAVDPLTGLINRPAYEFVFQQTLLETNRTKEPLSLILLEVDHFNRLVDLLGPGDSDQVLQNVAELTRKSVRGSDPVVRWSGDQFLIQLRNCPIENAQTVAERLRLSVVSYDFGVDDPRAIITVSLGVAMHKLQEPGESFQDRIYEELGLAKDKGGNRVEPELPPVPDDPGPAPDDPDAAPADPVPAEIDAGEKLSPAEG